MTPMCLGAHPNMQFTYGQDDGLTCLSTHHFTGKNPHLTHIPLNSPGPARPILGSGPGNGGWVTQDDGIGNWSGMRKQGSGVRSGWGRGSAGRIEPDWEVGMMVDGWNGLN